MFRDTHWSFHGWNKPRICFTVINGGQGRERKWTRWNTVGHVTITMEARWQGFIIVFSLLFLSVWSFPWLKFLNKKRILTMKLNQTLYMNTERNPKLKESYRSICIWSIYSDSVFVITKSGMSSTTVLTTHVVVRQGFPGPSLPKFYLCIVSIFFNGHEFYIL